MVWLDLMFDWLRHYGMKGVASLEKGSNRQQLHVQSIFECHSGEAEKPRLVASIKGHLNLGGDNSKLTVKPFEPSQRWEAMLGYVQKDWGEPHFQLRQHGVSQEELQQGRVRYRELKDDYMSGRVPLNRKTFLERVHAFRRANYHPFWVPMAVAVLHMLRSDGYVPGTSWVNARGGDIDYQKHEIWQFCVDRPGEVTLDMVEMLFYDEPEFRPGGRGARYFGGPFYMSEAMRDVYAFWRRHAAEPRRSFAAMNELRRMLQLRQVQMKPGRQMDEVFVACMLVEHVAAVRTMFASADDADAEIASTGADEDDDGEDETIMGNQPPLWEESLSRHLTTFTCGTR